MNNVIRPGPLRAAVLERRIRPLSRSLALRVLDVCHWNGIAARVVDRAPASLDELLDATRGPGPVPVSGEHAEYTIWGHPKLNALFRAWHDTVHVSIGAEFDQQGELRVAAAQRNHADSPADRELIWAETAGQDLAFRASGRFPRLQRAFVVHAIRFGVQAAVRAHRAGRFA